MRSSTSVLHFGAACIVLALSAGCSETGSNNINPVTPVSTRELPDSIVGKWEMYPAVGPSSRGCSIEFKESSFNQGKGSVSTFACNQVEGLGGLHGVSDFNKWERKGRTIILSGIAAPDIGTIDLPDDSFDIRVRGTTRDDIRFEMVRK